MTDVDPLIDHFFRREAGRLTAALARLVTPANLDLAEEVVQASLLEALRVWRTRGVPDNPAGWVRRVAKNKLIDRLRHRRIEHDYARRFPNEPTTFDAAFDDAAIADDQLRMIFVCCEPRLAADDRLALTLKSLCGFGIDELARAFLVAAETMKKRVQRARTKLAEWNVPFDLPSADCEPRLNAVHHVLYLLFNEGYLSTADDRAIRADLCDEAIRLGTMLADHPQLGRPSTDALVALMLFHAARQDARLDDAGRIVLLGDQDRTRWDATMLAQARARLDRSARGTVISRYHLEAGIARCHAEAESLAATDWPMIVRLYDALIAAIPSPVFELSRAVAIGERDGPKAGIEEIESARLPERLPSYHLVDAALGDFYRKLGYAAVARRHFEAALAKSPSPRERELLTDKIGELH